VADETTLKRPTFRAPVRFEVGKATVVGQVRSGNEDSVWCEPLESADVEQRGLFCAVADGMGGHAAGEVASDMAVRTAREAFYGQPDESMDEALRRAIELANHEVYEAGSKKLGREHMGSTMTAVAIHGDRAIVGHVGDSRCYLVRDGRIHQITRDHSWVAEEVEAGVLTPEEARVHPRRNIITRALGLRPQVEVDIYPTTVQVGSIFLICSDGLHGVVRDEEMLDRATRLPPQEAVNSLVALANERGGPDNISTIVVKLAPADEPMTQPTVPIADEATTPPAIAPLPPPHDARAAREEAPHAAASPAHSPSNPPASAHSSRPTATPDDRPAARRPVAHEPAAPPARKRGGPTTGLLVGVLLGLVILGAAIGLFLLSSSGMLGQAGPASQATAAPTAVGAPTPPQPTPLPPTAAAPPTVAAPTAAPAAPPPTVGVPAAGAPLATAPAAPPQPPAPAAGPTGVPAAVATPAAQAAATATAGGSGAAGSVIGRIADAAGVGGLVRQPTPGQGPNCEGGPAEIVLRVTSSGAAVRRAPSERAPKVDGLDDGELDQGAQIVSDGCVQGDAIDGNTRWYSIKRNLGSDPVNPPAFIHSSLVSE
jgi:protein phosphatase